MFQGFPYYYIVYFNKLKETLKLGRTGYMKELV